MSPLERCLPDGSVILHQDDEEFNRSQWARILGKTTGSVSGAQHRGGARIKHRDDPSPKLAAQLMTPVKDFPKIIKGFQGPRALASGQKDHYDPWSLGIDTEAEVFYVDAPSGEELTFVRSKQEED